MKPGTASLKMHKQRECFPPSIPFGTFLEVSILILATLGEPGVPCMAGKCLATEPQPLLILRCFLLKYFSSFSFITNFTTFVSTVADVLGGKWLSFICAFPSTLESCLRKFVLVLTLHI